MATFRCGSDLRFWRGEAGQSLPVIMPVIEQRDSETTHSHFHIRWRQQPTAEDQTLTKP